MAAGVSPIPLAGLLGQLLALTIPQPALPIPEMPTKSTPLPQ